MRGNEFPDKMRGSACGCDWMTIQECVLWVAWVQVFTNGRKTSPYEKREREETKGLTGFEQYFSCLLLDSVSGCL